MLEFSPAQGQLLELAPELLELVLSFLGSPRDVVSFGQTSRRANAFVRPSNQVLWRSAFLKVFDDPKDAWELLLPTARAANRERESSWDWYQELRRRCSAFNAVCQTSSDTIFRGPEDVVTALLDILETSSYGASNVDPRGSLNLDFLDRLFEVAPNPEKFVHDYHRDIDSVSLPLELLADSDRPLTRSMLERKAIIPAWASRFHVFYGSTAREVHSIRAKASARGIVYDWSVTGPASEYGPFAKDMSGDVNWQTLEAVSSLMLRIFNTARNSYLLTASGFRNSVPHTLSVNSPTQDDWAGITRVWVGTYAFLDYRALVHYNFANRLEYQMDLGAYEEACGDLMRLRLKMNDSEELRNDPRLQTELPYCDDLPKIYFKGCSHGRPTGRPSILVRGSVCLVPGGRQVRWRFIISYAGADQWQLEGVQPGGVRSGGIYGLWSHVDHDDHGPMGPFCYFPHDACGTSKHSTYGTELSINESPNE